MSIFGQKSSRQRQRNRQTPDAQSAVYSYYQRRSARNDAVGRDPEAIESQKRKKPRAIQHIPSLILLVAILVSMFYVSTIDPRVKVNQIDQPSSSAVLNLRNDGIYQAAAQHFIEKSLVNRSKFLIDSDGLRADLQRQFPELAAVTVTLPIMGRRPVISIQTTKPAFILASGTQSVLVGNNGVALVDVRDVDHKERLNLKTVQDESGLAIEPGKAALPKEQALFIASVVEQLESQHIPIERLTIPRSPYDLHVRIKDRPYFVKFNVLEDPLQQSGAFVALQQKLEAEQGEPKEYIDVRVGERVFYR